MSKLALGPRVHKPRVHNAPIAQPESRIVCPARKHMSACRTSVSLSASASSCCPSASERCSACLRVRVRVRVRGFGFGLRVG